MTKVGHLIAGCALSAEAFNRLPSKVVNAAEILRLRWHFRAIPLPLRDAKICVMAGQLKEVRNRIKSVQNTQQITKAMKMVSAAKLRKAQDAIIQMRPYAKKLQEMLSNIVSGNGGDMDVSLATERPIDKVLIITITSDRGLAGAYNSTLIKLD